MCQTCRDTAHITADEISNQPPDDVIGWLAYNSPPRFLRFVLSEYPDAIAEYMTAVRHNTVDIVLNAGHPTALAR